MLSNLEKKKLLNSEISKLEDEIDELLLDNKEKIIEQYRLYKECYNNKIFIDNLENKNIRIKDNIYVLNKINEVLYEGVTNKSTIYFGNCNDITVVISAKVNHITLERCQNVNIKIIGGSVSGIDNIHCENISYIFDDNDIYFIDISNCINCNMYIPEAIATNTLIITLYSIGVNFFILNNQNIKKVFRKNNNYLDTMGKYCFKIDNGVLNLHNF